MSSASYDVIGSFVRHGVDLCVLDRDDSNILHVLVTARVCGRGNVFVVCVCMSVCLSVWAITFEAVDIETSFLVWWYILTISRSSLSIKVIGSGQGHPMDNANFATWTSV